MRTTPNPGNKYLNLLQPSLRTPPERSDKAICEKVRMKNPPPPPTAR
ncbi:hypothetical protein A2U01_0117368, partial [Trifolium medium]|nr:hypothetical protein [Trifolium medium]